MLGLYRSLLYLYPAPYRGEFGEEMMDVLSEVQAEISSQSLLGRLCRTAREAGGLLTGALGEHLRSITGAYDRGRFPSMFSSTFLSGRFAMKSEFRFPKATVVLMTVILAAVMLTIEKAKAISASVPHGNPPVGPIQPTHFAIVPSLLVAMMSALLLGLIGWAILFALRRSGVQQLSEMNPPSAPPSGH
jgi:hypothetical protein